MPAIAFPEDLLTEHVDHLNACLRTGVFSSWADRFTGDGELKLLGGGVASGDVHRGHDAIAAACRRVWSGRNEGVKVITVIAASPGSATFDYAWRSAPKTVAGQMILRWNGEGITRMTVTL